MERAFPKVDFMEFNFTRHMLTRLKTASPEGYRNVVQALRETWVVRTNQLIKCLGGKVVLLWFGENLAQQQLSNSTFLVTRRMIERVNSNCIFGVEVAFGEETQALGTEGMHFLGHEFEAAKRMLNPMAHHDITKALLPVLERNLV
ncbi:MAG: DUF6473 family protein [Paracoccaceae bacterium]|nr:DUF6473 family protein [Paracoccaceae bacterium]